ncbi:hypothetical protein KDA_61530 [Dictyobacter alpinus]|uniref:Uncharacterized protein n=1 Tax=Dictyobacter alpinus TaxID=2014873 RepID=A0A402BH67_9CHLR|nr:hypothetical protein KDA_61530 [Dictyobacter alpinus]
MMKNGVVYLAGRLLSPARVNRESGIKSTINACKSTISTKARHIRARKNMFQRDILLPTIKISTAFHYHYHA